MSTELSADASQGPPIPPPPDDWQPPFDDEAVLEAEPFGGPRLVREQEEAPKVPAEIDAEREVLASGLVNPQDAMEMPAVSRLRGSDFYVLWHGHLWEAMRSVYQEHGHTDPTLVAAAAKAAGHADAVDLRRLSPLLDRAGLSYRADEYAKLVLRASDDRTLLHAAQDLQRALMRPGVTREERASAADRVRAAAEGGRLEVATGELGADSVVPTRQAVFEPHLLRRRRAANSDLPSLKKLLHVESGLVLIGGFQGGGKSTLIDNHVVLPSAAEGLKVAVFHLEMDQHQVRLRRASRMSGVPYWMLRENAASVLEGRGNTMSRQDVRKFETAMGLLGDLTTLITDYSKMLTAEAILERCREYKRRLGGLDVVVIDHLHAMQHGRGFGTEASALGESVLRLNGGLDQLGALGVLGAQLRKQQIGAAKRPSLGDFRGTSVAADLAGAAAIIWDPGEGQDRTDMYGNPRPSTRRLSCVKFRDGESGWDSNLVTDLACYRFAGEA